MKPREKKRYYFVITEVLQKNVTIEAPYEDIAKRKLLERYNDGKIVLGADQFVDMTIKRARK